MNKGDKVLHHTESIITRLDRLSQSINMVFGNHIDNHNVLLILELSPTNNTPSIHI